MRRRRNYLNRLVSVNKEFDSNEINEDLDKFSNVLEGGCLTTTYDGHVICKVDVSKVYYNFDFTNFSKSIVSEIQKYFTPEKYKLKAASGSQEIRLVGDELYIDNERYEKIISIVNSTDKTKALSMNVGLIRKEKGKLAKSITMLISFGNKHYKSSLPDKIKSFSDNLINFNMNIDFHIKTIEDLKNKDINFISFAKSILFNDKGKVIKSIEYKLRLLGQKLDYEYGFSKYHNTLIGLTPASIDKLEDFVINASVLFNAYVEIFKDQDTSIIARESKRVIEALDKL